MTEMQTALFWFLNRNVSWILSGSVSRVSLVSLADWIPSTSVHCVNVSNLKQQSVSEPEATFNVLIVFLFAQVFKIKASPRTLTVCISCLIPLCAALSGLVFLLWTGDCEVNCH